MKYALMLTLALLLAACGGDPYKAPPAGNGTSSANVPGQPKIPSEKPTGADMEPEYTKAAKAAFAARDKFRGDKTADNFALWGASMFDALRFGIMQGRHKRSTSGFYKYKEIREMRTDFTKTIGPSGWEDNTVYKAAKKAYDDVQQTE